MTARDCDPRLTAYHAGWRAGAIGEARAWQGDPAVEAEYRRGYRDGEKDRVRDSKRARARILGGEG